MNWINRIFSKSTGGNDMATAKNYSDKDVNFMLEAYNNEPTRATVDMIAEKLGKNARSVIAKLSREGVYKAQPRVTKRGEPVVLKSEFVDRIHTALGIEIPTIVKATKADLSKLADHLEAQ
jgi:hypothetical protein|tara:strand:- start:775 stop:1137 length:363 start_codon:yes stop_codon:yes gene_type:complete